MSEHGNISEGATAPVVALVCHYCGRRDESLTTAEMWEYVRTGKSRLTVDPCPQNARGFHLWDRDE